MNSSLLSILYLDDNQVFVKSICLLLKNYDLHCAGFSDSATAVDAIEINPTAFDVFVTDYNMPGLSGIDVAIQVRQINPDLPIVLTSGFIDDEVRERAAKVGIKWLIAKPFQTIEFVNLLRRLKV